MAMPDCSGALLAAPSSRPIFPSVLDELRLVFLFPPILFLCAGLPFVSREALSNLKTWFKYRDVQSSATEDVRLMKRR